MAPDRPVLDAALDAGLNLPHSCKGGNCGACRVRLLAGEVTYPNGRWLQYTYDAAGNRTRKQQLDYTEDYQYDTLYRLP